MRGQYHKNSCILHLKGMKRKCLPHIVFYSTEVMMKYRIENTKIIMGLAETGFMI
jgi:hypothetical protein